MRTIVSALLLSVPLSAFASCAEDEAAYVKSLKNLSDAVKNYFWCRQRFDDCEDWELRMKQSKDDSDRTLDRTILGRYTCDYLYMDPR